MATWVEDIVQALENLGGQAHRRQIINEVKRIRTEPLPKNVDETIQERIQAHSSDSAHFQGKDLFRRIGNGVWGLTNLSGSSQPFLAEPVIHYTNPHDFFPQPLSNKYNDQIMKTDKYLEVSFNGNESIDEIINKMAKMWSKAQEIGADYFRVIGRLPDENIEYYRKSNEQGVSYWRVPTSQNNMTTRGQFVSTLPTVVRYGGVRKSKTNAGKPIHLSSIPGVMISNNIPKQDTFEEIKNVLRTIKQYRDYQHPDSPTWKEYVDEFFHILGFVTDEKNPRLVTLNVMGSTQTPRALVVYISPGENFDEMVPGLPWESYLVLAANYYQIDWGILTDGLQLKLIYYQDRDVKQHSYWPDLDNIVQEEMLDAFFTIYKTFSFLKNASSSLNVERKQKKMLHNEAINPRLEFWKQLIEKGNKRGLIPSNKSPKAFNWISLPTGKSGITYDMVLRQNNAEIQLYIDQGDVVKNKDFFDFLFQSKYEIEKDLDVSLDWQRLDVKRACRISSRIDSYGFKDNGHWEDLQDQMIELTIKLVKAFQPFIEQTRIRV